MFPEINIVRFDELPFPHFAGEGRIDQISHNLLNWLENDAPWQLATTDFYEQHELSLNHVSLPASVKILACRNTLSALSRLMARQFHQSVSKNVGATAHKLVAGQTIRLHNDFIEGGESHRLVIQLNRDWEPDHGGYLMLFSGPEPETVAKVFEPTNGSAMAFAISPRSYHAVSTVHGGERFTIVYSFYRDSS